MRLNIWHNSSSLSNPEQSSFICYVFFYNKLKFQKQAGACLWKKLVQAESMLALYLFIKILLRACLRKRLDQAWIWLYSKNYYKKCAAVVTQTKCNRPPGLNLFCCIFDESEGKCFTIYLTEKIIVSMAWKNSCYPEKCLT